MSDYESDVALAMRMLTGALCHVAAGAHSDNEGRQREMAGVFYNDCQNQFVDVLRKLDPELQRQFEERVAEMCRPKKSKRK
jgi:hypothetical protein